MGIDWYPLSRDGQIHMVETWLQVFQTRAVDWGIPGDHAPRRGYEGEAGDWGPVVSAIIP
ncbi:MAG: hypothetical protein LBC62_00960 [Treponema sp.]|jgi:hypothetical protein|nr:hypothetical protein [Treponema sp.]